MCQQQNYVVPNYLIPKGLRGYSSGRMARRRGDLEERLRAAVKVYVRGPEGDRSYQGRNKKVATAIGRPESWVTEYINGENHANLDTSLALMRFLGWSLTADLSGASGPSLDPELIAQLQDAETAERVRRFVALQAELQAVLVQMPPLGDIARTPERSGESKSGPIREIRTKSAGSRNR